MINNRDNYNTRVIIATIISTILMVAWVKFYGEKTIPNIQSVEQEKIEQKEENILKEENKQKREIAIEEKKIKIEDNKNIGDKFLIIETDKLKGNINLKGLIFNDLILEQYNEKIGSAEKIKLLTEETNNSGYFVEFGWKSNNKNLDLPNKNTLWYSDNEKLTINNPVILSYKSRDGLLFNIIISIDQNYMFTIKQIVTNGTENNVPLKITNKIIRNKFSKEETSAGVHDGFIGSFNNTIEEVKYSKLLKKKYSFNQNFSWAGFTIKYWLVSFANYMKSSDISNVSTTYQNENYVINFESKEIKLKPHQENEITSLLFAGPKILNLLDQYGFQYELSLFDRSVDFGWFYFLTKPIYILLKAFYNFFGNFGVAILFLTFIVKTVMYPFTKKSYISIAKMKSAQPKIEALKSRYADDKMRMNKELIQLYKKENISPLSGCLPMLVQIPVFFSLYKVLAISIDMRQAPFFGYIKDLSVEDPTTIWNLFGLLPYNVNFLHIGLLPCLMSLTMWIQQRIGTNNTSSNNETQMATKIMPIIFLFMFAGMPAGLLIYWTFSNIITIGQQYYVERILLKKFNK